MVPEQGSNVFCRRFHGLLFAAVVMVGLSVSLGQSTLYWDGNGSPPGGGGGTWDTTALNWNLNPNFVGPYQAWNNSNHDDAVFGVSGGTVSVSGGVTARSLDLRVDGYTFSSSAITLAGSSFGTINVVGGTGTMGSAIAGSSGFTKTGAGTLALTTNSTATGYRRVLGGTLRIDNGGRLASSGTVLLDGGTLLNTNASLGSFLTVTTLEIGSNGGTIANNTNIGTYGGTIIGPGNTLHKAGAGEFRYQGNNIANTTYGRLVVTDGLFRVGTTDDRGFGAVPNSFMPNQITLQGGAIGVGTGTTGIAMTLQGNRGIQVVSSGTINTVNGTLTINSSQLNGSGTLFKDGTHAFVINAAQPNFTGDFTILSGRVEANASNSLGSGDLIFALNGAATLINNSTPAASVTLPNAINLGSGSGVIDITAGANQTMTLSGKITGSRNWLRGTSGATGTVVLTNSQNDFSGGLTVSIGRLEITANNALGSAAGATTISSGGLVMSGGFNYTTLEPLRIAGSGVGGDGVIHNASGDNRFAGPITLTGFSTVTIADGSLELAGPITGAFGLTKQGPGALTLSNTGNTFSNLPISAGTLVVSADGNLGVVPGVPTSARISIADGATLRATETFSIHPNRGINLLGGAGAIDVVNGRTLSYDGIIVGSSLLKRGGGTFTLGGANTYDGLSTIDAGTLKLLNTATIASSVHVASGATFDVTAMTSGFTLAPDRRISGSGNVAGNLIVQGTIAPGASTGALVTTGTQHWAPGGTYEWEIESATGTAGVAWDKLTMNVLNVSATPASRFNIKIIALPGSGSPALDNFNPNSPYTWVIAQAVSGAIDNLDLNDFLIDVTQFNNNNPNSGTFRVRRSGAKIEIHYVPEPGGASVLLLGLALLLRRRMRQSR